MSQELPHLKDKGYFRNQILDFNTFITVIFIFLFTHYVCICLAWSLAHFHGNSRSHTVICFSYLISYWFRYKYLWKSLYYYYYYCTLYTFFLLVNKQRARILGLFTGWTNKGFKSMSTRHREMVSSIRSDWAYI